MKPRVVVAADNGLVYCADGAVFLRNVGGEHGDVWRELTPIPGTQRDVDLEVERCNRQAELNQPAYIERLREAS